MKKTILAILLLLSSANLTAQGTTLTFSFDFPTADISSVARFEYRINSAPYTPIGIPTILNDILTAPGSDSRQFDVLIPVSGTYTIAVRACTVDRCTADSNSVTYKLIGSPTNLRIKK